jgi:hypothetical protein
MGVVRTRADDRRANLVGIANEMRCLNCVDSRFRWQRSARGDSTPERPLAPIKLLLSPSQNENVFKHASFRCEVLWDFVVLDGLGNGAVIVVLTMA